jgi:hydrogenase/urease accessory protein HupE
MVALIALPAAAHEIGTTRVRVSLKSGAYAIDVITSRASLAQKLARRGGTLRDAAHIAFGAQRVTPAMTMLADGVRYTGAIPRNAGAFTWQFDLTYADYAVIIETPHAPPQRQWVSGDARSVPFPLDRRLLPPTRAEVIRQYLALGFTHIIPLGIDHILFVLGIFLLSSRVRPVLTQVTAFTIAHSITLGLTIYGVVSVPSRFVEPLIALSIAYVAIENLVTTELKPWRVGIVFGFGLLHGLGFAGVLRELGLPRSEFLTGLISFNAGVEIAQLCVISVAWMLIVSWAGTKTWYRQRLLVPASLAIAVTGLVWMIERI